MTILGKYLSVKEMKIVELNAEHLGIGFQELMECAGKSVADQIMDRFSPKSKVVIISGLSGNGGDGFVTARHLASMGYNVEVYVLGDPDWIQQKYSKVNYEILEKMSATVSIQKVTDTTCIPNLKADVIVDGLIGTNMRGVLRTPYLEMVQAINKTDAYKISIDVPTGMESDTGDVHGIAVKADLTVTFHKPKLGFKNASVYTGELILVPIGIPLEAELFVGPGDVWAVQRKRDSNAHKGMFGRLLIVGGSETYSGAPALTTMGAYATGIDLVYTAVPETVAQAIMSLSPSFITIKLEGEHFTEKNIEQLKHFFDIVDAVAIGPGLGRHPDTVKAFKKLFKTVQHHNLPCVVDADGIRAYADNKSSIKGPIIFTPHRNEFHQLTGKEVSGDFFEKGRIVEKEAKKLGAAILLKGSVDILSNGDSTRYNWTGNPGMTVGGTGDVLSGVTAGFIAQGPSLMEAAAAASFVNGKAGDLVYQEKGYHLLPEDLVEKIPYIIEECKK
jgi:NAD(P)H-hydrate epimerase